jgi:YHS domain-containing protein
MPKSKLFPTVLALVAATLLIAAFAFASGEGVRPALKKVEAKKVCMINNQLFEKDQIPVSVEGKTYYGCCEMCKERLTKDRAARTALDPVTHKEVDKATAVIAAQPDGKVLYFQSEKTLEEYQKNQAR